MRESRFHFHALCMVLCVSLVQIAVGVSSASAQPTSTVCSYTFTAAETGWRSHPWTAADCSNGLPQSGWTGVGQGMNGSGTSGQVSCQVTTGSHYNNPATHGATTGTVKCLFAPPASAPAHPSPDVTTCRYTFADVSDGWRTRFWAPADCSNGLPQAGARAVGQGQTGTGNPGMVTCELTYASHYTHPYADGPSTATITCTYVAPTQVAAPEFTRCSYAFDYYYTGWQTRTWTAADCSHGLPAAGAWGVGQAMNGSGGPQMASCAPTSGGHYNLGATVGAVACLFRNPTPTPACSYEITSPTQSFVADGGTATVTVTSGVGCSWSATSQANWISITGAGSGSGNGYVSYSVQPNASAQPRDGAIVVAGQILSVSQAAGDASTLTTSTICSYTFTAAETGWRSRTWIAADCSNGLPQAGWTGVGQGLNGNGTSGQVSCHVTSGLHYNNPATHGATTGTVRCLFAPPASGLVHPSPDVTTCKYTFADVADGWRSHNWVSSDCSNGVPATGARAVGQGQTGTGNPGMVTCEPSYASHYTHPYIDGASTATVTCTYVAPTQVAAPEFTRCSYGFDSYYTGWQTRNWTPADCSHGLPAPGAWGIGQAVNGSGGPQAASCTPTTGSHYNVSETVGAVSCLYRNPTPPPGCSYAITPTTQSFAANGGTGTVSVTGGAGCSWWVTSHASWISIVNNSSGTGNGSMDYSVQANTSTQPRESTIVVAGHPLTVSQAAAPACTTVTLSPASTEVTASGGTASVSVSALPAGCSWSAISPVSWISVTGNPSTATMSYTIAPSTAPSERYASIVVGNATFAVRQHAASPTVPMTLAIYDTFAGDPWTPLTLHMPDVRNVGGNWSVSGPAPVLHSGTLKMGAYHPSLKSTALIDTGSSDSIISVDWWPTSASSTNVGHPLGVVIARALDENNFIAAGYGLWGGHYLALAKYDDGEWTLLASADPGPHTGMRHLDVKVHGTSIQVWSDGALLIQTLEGMFGDGTKQGVIFWPGYDWLSGFDNFTIATPEQSAAVTPHTPGDETVRLAQAPAVVASISTNGTPSFAQASEVSVTHDARFEMPMSALNGTRLGFLDPTTGIHWRTAPQPSKVPDQCFGNCGAGCTSKLIGGFFPSPCESPDFWSLELVSAHTSPALVGSDTREECIGPEAYSNEYDVYAGTVRWTYHGVWTQACEDHDWAMRQNPIDGAVGILPFMLGICAGPTQHATWSYETLAIGLKLRTPTHLPEGYLSCQQTP